jgi:hypothetical protein
MFAIASTLLTVLAVMLVGYAVYQVVTAMAAANRVLSSGDFGYIVIDSVGYVVIAIAILDIAKHLFDEEVLQAHEFQSDSTSRRNFSRFISIISIAVFLEGLVLVFKVTQDDIKLLVYPVLLLLVGVAMTMGLALTESLAKNRTGRDDGSA